MEILCLFFLFTGLKFSCQIVEKKIKSLAFLSFPPYLIKTPNSGSPGWSGGRARVRCVQIEGKAHNLITLPIRTFTKYQNRLQF